MQTGRQPKRPKIEPRPLSKEDVEEALALIQRILDFSNGTGINLARYLIGTFGELLVARELLKIPEGVLRYRSGQSGYDLLFSLKGRQLKVEVKTSTLKNENLWKDKDLPEIPECGLPHKVYAWGWRFGKEGKSGAEKFDLAILVALKEREGCGSFNWSLKHFYVVPRSEFRLLEEKTTPHFTSVKRSIYLFEDPRYIAILRERYPDFVKSFDEHFNKNSSKYVDDSLSWILGTL